ncbi:hypothetical protein PF008_g33138 [Phytophthora fragariae]|uniref:Uncharacterized protein n=1 Tax=Phytophthora fragariae TaxID=53985 RepID=A0A6G0PYC8_9STRA|nr:hypothetical protein PF008_g33138 [Phytophthora fragariae]
MASSNNWGSITLKPTLLLSGLKLSALLSTSQRFSTVNWRSSSSWSSPLVFKLTDRVSFADC